MTTNPLKQISQLQKEVAELKEKVVVMERFLLFAPSFSSYISNLETKKGEDVELLKVAIEFAKENKTISPSFLQRKLNIGYARAAKLIDHLSEKGIVGPPNGTNPREVIQNQER